MVKNKVSINGKTTIAITPYNRDWLKGLGKMGDSYDDVIDAIREILKQRNIKLS